MRNLLSWQQSSMNQRPLHLYVSLDSIADSCEGAGGNMDEVIRQNCHFTNPQKFKQVTDHVNFHLTDPPRIAYIFHT